MYSSAAASPAVVAIALELGVVDADHAVGPVEELVAVLLGHAHHLGDGLQRQLGGDVDDEVALALLDDVVDDEDRPGAAGTVSSSPIMRGVKPLLTSRRYRVCRGGSMYSIIRPRGSSPLVAGMSGGMLMPPASTRTRRGRG